LCPSSSPGADAIVSALQEAELDARVLQADDTLGPGIVLCSELSEEAFAFTRVMSRNGSGRVLVLVPGAATLAAGESWRLLSAGACDVLSWNRLPEPGRTIAARFKRWHDVDKLSELPLIKNHLVGESRIWKLTVQRLVEAALYTDSPVLLTGETGTGKELAARLIHTLNPRQNKGEVVVLDCTTIVPELSGSELFGHEKGAFTGAVAAREGAFALADKGTLFLDEVGELSPALQIQLLRVLQEHTYKRVGSNVWRQTDFRLICATNQDLRQEEAEGRFRRDLFHRIAALEITMPPLRERIEDVIRLACNFMKETGTGEPPEIDEAVRAYLLTRDYPGNVRDLRNLVYRIMARYVGVGPITVGDISPDERPDVGCRPQDWCNGAVEGAIRQAFAAGVGLKEIRHCIEETAIRIALEDERGNLQRAAQKLAVTDRALQKRRAEQNRQLGSMI
jgi:transcriptional regulator with GAF, ATPase, and Fis domain